MKTKIIALFTFVCAFATAAYCQTSQSSTDQAIINVKCSVKSVTENDGYSSLVYAFNTTGKMTKYQSNSLSTANTKRDSQGRLTQIVLKETDEFGEEYDAVITFTYDAQGYLSKMKVENIYGSWVENYTYNAKGLRISTKITESVENVTYKYQYVTFDAQGNWTKMVKTDPYGGKETFTRKITYY